MMLTHPPGSSEKFKGLADEGLYWRALDWCVQQIHRRHVVPPPEWCIPKHVVATWGGQRPARNLVDTDVWKESDGGYVFVYVHKANTPEAFRREKARDRKRKQPEAS